jgi:hypothetical protein
MAVVVDAIDENARAFYNAMASSTFRITRTGSSCP